MRSTANLLTPVMAVVACVAAMAQAPTYRLGRTPTEAEIRAQDIAIGAEGKELPPGSGTATKGAQIYEQKCAACHGPTGTEGSASRLVGGKGTLTTLHPEETVGSYWPFATTIWDYINRSMPLNLTATSASQAEAESLSPDEVYALTAFLLYRNDIIKQSDVIDAKSLPKIQMPNRNGFVPARPEWKNVDKVGFPP
jgi:cytochrome c